MFKTCLQITYIFIVIFITIASSQLSELKLYSLASDKSSSGIQPNGSISITCHVDLSRGAQADIIWYRRIGKLWQIIGSGDSMSTNFHSSRYTLMRTTMSRLTIVFTMTIQNLKVEDSAAIYCSGYKQLPEDMTPLILNICNEPGNWYCNCMSKDMSSNCALNILTKESNSSAMQRASIAIAVSLAIMLLIAIILTVFVIKRDCLNKDTLQDVGTTSNTYDNNVSEANRVPLRSNMNPNKLAIPDMSNNYAINVPEENRVPLRSNMKPKKVVVTNSQNAYSKPQNIKFQSEIDKTDRLNLSSSSSRSPQLEHNIASNTNQIEQNSINSNYDRQLPVENSRNPATNYTNCELSFVDKNKHLRQNMANNNNNRNYNSKTNNGYLSDGSSMV